MHRVFVYGTLKKQYTNHYLLKDARYLGEAFTVDGFKMFNVGFPIIRLHDEGKSVLGEVYEVDDATLKRLDALEAEGHMYDRKKVDVVYTGGSIDQTNIEAGVYVYIGNDKYWDKHTPMEWTKLSEHGELEWGRS